jgi:hypothetical protein
MKMKQQTYKNISQTQNWQGLCCYLIFIFFSQYFAKLQQKQCIRAWIPRHYFLEHIAMNKLVQNCHHLYLSKPLVMILASIGDEEDRGDILQDGRENRFLVFLFFCL